MYRLGTIRLEYSDKFITSTIPYEFQFCRYNGINFPYIYDNILLYTVHTHTLSVLTQLRIHKHISFSQYFFSLAYTLDINYNTKMTLLVFGTYFQNRKKNLHYFSRAKRNYSNVLFYVFYFILSF